jgi:hypothetical protein
MKIGDIYIKNLNGSEFEIIKIDKIEGQIENVKIRNVNNKQSIQDISNYELLINYNLKTKT